MLRRKLVMGSLIFRFNVVITLFLVLTVTGLVRLGLWQLDRAEEKIAFQERFQAKRGIAAVAIQDLALAGREQDSVNLQNRQVSLDGRFLNEQSLFLIYQTHEEQLGFEVVTPFELHTGNQVVLVSRGWTGAQDYDTLKQKVPLLKGPRTVRGQIYVPRAAEAARLNRIQQVRWPLLIRHLNIAELEPLFASPLFPYVVRLNQGEEGLLVPHWPEVHVDTGRNFSYALQWFAMAIAVTVAALLLSSNLLGGRQNR